MVDFIGANCGHIRLPGIMMLGYVAAHTEALAMAVIVCKVGWVFYRPFTAMSSKLS